MRTPLPKLLALLFAPSLLATPIRAEEPGPRLHLAPIFSEGGESSQEVTLQVQRRLQQMGETPQLLPAGKEFCKDLSCGLRQAAGLRSGRLIGGTTGPIPSGGRRASLWWIDLDRGQMLERSFSCRDCEVGEAMAHHMALLVEQAAVRPDCSAVPNNPMGREPQAESVRSALSQGLSLSVRAVGGARVAVAPIENSLQRTLLEMGVPSVFVEGRGPSASATFSIVPTLEVDLQGGPGGRGAVERIALTLQVGGEPRQLRFYCPKDTCQSHLAQHVALNLGLLFDSSTPAMLTIPRADCLAPLPVLTLVAGPPPPDSPSGISNGVQGSPVPPAVCPLTSRQRGLRIGGITLLSLGAIGIVTGGVLLSQNGKENGSTDCNFGGRSSKCQWDSVDGSKAAFALGGIGVGLGGLSFGLSYLKNGDPCTNGKP